MGWRHDFLDPELTAAIVRRRARPLIGDWLETVVELHNGQWCYADGGFVEPKLADEIDDARKLEGLRRKRREERIQRLRRWHPVEYVEPGERRFASVLASAILIERGGRQ